MFLWDTMFLMMDTRFYVAGIHLDIDKNSNFKPCKNTIKGQLGHYLFNLLLE